MQKARPDPLYAVKALAESYQWYQALDTHNHRTIKEFSEAIHVDYNRVLDRLRLKGLSPKIQQQCLDGSLPQRITLKHLTKASTQLDWKRQEAYLSV